MAAPIVRRNIQVGSKHFLSVRKIAGKPGRFTSAAIYCEPANTCAGWSHSQILPGPKEAKLSQKGTYVIEVVASFDRKVPDQCEVVSEIKLPGGSMGQPSVRILVNNSTSSDRVKISLQVV